MDLADIDLQLPLSHTLPSIPEQSESSPLPPIPTDEQFQNYLLKQALLLVDAGDFSLALHVLGDILYRNPQHADAIKWMGYCFKAEGDLHNSLTCYRQLAALTNADQDLFELGEIQYVLQQNEDAEKTWQQALSVCPEESPRLFDIYRCLGNVAMRLRDLESAEEHLNKAFRIRPDSDLLQVSLGSLAVQKENWPQAMGRYSAAVEKNPYNDRAWCGVALVAREQKDSGWAESAVLKALDIDPCNLLALELLTRWSLEDQNPQVAIHRIEEYLQIRRDDVHQTFVFAGLLLQVGRVQEADIELSKAEAMEPDHAGLAELRIIIDRRLSA